MTGQERHIQTVCLLILASFAVASTLFLMRAVLVPFVLAMFFVYAISPLVDMQIVRFKLPRLIAILTTLILVIMLSLAFARIISASVAELVNNAHIYQQRFEQLAQALEDWALMDFIVPGDGDKSEQQQPPTIQLPRLDSGFDFQLELPDEDGSTVKKWDSEALLALFSDRIRAVFLETARALLALLSQGVIIFIFVMFLLLGGSVNPKQGQSMLGRMEHQVRRYIVAKVLISALTGILVGFVLWVLGVNLALMFGLLVFLLNFIPSIGSIIATLLPIPIVVLNPELSAIAAILAIAIPGLIQLLVGLVLEPRIMGQSLDLHPVTVLLALIFWGTIWGIVGMLLAVPLTAVVKMVLERIDLTRPVADVLAGRLDRV